ncbi:MAG: CPBP family intramembrane glutamic endopeptidase [Anaerotignum sp.]
MNDAFSNYISEKIETGYFHTEITTNDIQDYITIFFDRITRNLILAKYYNSDEILKKPNFHKDELIHMLFPPNSLLYKFSLDTVSNEMKRTILTLNLLCNGLIAPIMEELYFRGFLLPT